MFTTTLIFHIIAGSTGLLSGAATLYFRKGSRQHAITGTIFVCAMLAMTGSGLAMAIAERERETAAVAILTAYLVVTSWRTARHRDGRSRLLEWFAPIVPIGCASALLLFGIDAVRHPRPEVPPQGLFIFAVLAALPAGLDLNYLLRQQLSGSQRITRHLWRMCTALLFAAFSFFQGQAHVFPPAIRHSYLLFVPTLAIAATIPYWIVRIRFSKHLRQVLAIRTSSMKPDQGRRP